MANSARVKWTQFSHCCSLVLMNCNLLIIPLHGEAKSGPAALSAVSLLAFRGKKKNMKGVQPRNNNINWNFTLNGYSSSVAPCANVGSSEDILIWIADLSVHISVI